MKKFILILAATFAVATVKADDLSATQRQQRQVQPRRAVIEQPHGEGAVQWALRLHNPLQAINPFAPPEYGDGSAFVDYYPEYDPSQHHPADKPKAQGIKLFSFRF